MRSAVIISLAVVGLSALSPAAKACGLYGLNHHMDKGNYTIAPFKPDPETTPVFKPKVYTSDPALTRRKAGASRPSQSPAKQKPVFAASVQEISLRARQRIMTPRPQSPTAPNTPKR